MPNPVNVYRQFQCGCGSLQFQLDADDNKGVAKRSCAKCAKDVVTHLLDKA